MGVCLFFVQKMQEFDERISLTFTVCKGKIKPS